jgi:hypothetical protein
MTVLRGMFDIDISDALKHARFSMHSALDASSCPSISHLFTSKHSHVLL